MPPNLAIYIVRHAEKPDEGSDLSPAGHARATAYVNFFQNLKDLSGKTISWKFLFASADSPNSDRPVSTIQPLSDAIKISIDSKYKDKDYPRLVNKIQTNRNRSFENSNILICWHHGEILNLADSLGASCNTLPANSNWPLKWQG